MTAEPLAGRRILVTRSPHQASDLAAQLAAQGAIPVLIPTIEIVPPASFCALDAAFLCLSTYDWLVFTSANAVEAFHRRAQQQRLTQLPRRIAAIGPATERAARAIGLTVDLIPSEYVAESLAEALLPEAPGRSFLLVRAAEARDVLPDALTAAGATVTIAPAYANRIPEASLTAIASLFATPETYPDAITFTSASTARNLVALLDAAGLVLPRSIPCASIGPVTSRALYALDLSATIEAAEPSLASLVAALAEHFNKAPDGTLQTMTHALLKSDLGSLPLIARGKVRDLYALGEEQSSDLLFVATDRISAFDHVLASGIPDKGAILTQISAFWFDFLAETVPNHLLPAIPQAVEERLAPFADQLAGRSMIVRRARMFPVECVVRGYLSGSGWKDYQATGAVCGISLPAGLRESERLPEPIFTPAAKINTGGHDENISYARMEEMVGVETAARLRDLTLSIYAKASAYAATRGLILADTKFEFGEVDGRIVLADEVLTPDSSRYWPAATYAAGGPQPSFDKQYVRDYLESIGWNKQAPAPGLPADVIARTRQKYMEAFHLITGREALRDESNEASA